MLYARNATAGHSCCRRPLRDGRPCAAVSTRHRRPARDQRTRSDPVPCSGPGIRWRLRRRRCLLCDLRISDHAAADGSLRAPRVAPARRFLCAPLSADSAGVDRDAGHDCAVRVLAVSAGRSDQLRQNSSARPPCSWATWPCCAQRGYFDLQTPLNPLAHLWSIAVEEQFYLIFPLIFIISGVIDAPPALAAVRPSARIVRAMCLGALYARPTLNFFLAPTRAWELLLGALVAMGVGRSLRRAPSQRRACSRLHSSRSPAALVGVRPPHALIPVSTRSFRA